MKKLTRRVIWALVGLCSIAGCAQPDYKADADEKVYRIIDQKWRDDFGSKANYKVSDVAPSPDAIRIEKAVPVSGVLSLSEATALATAHNRDYQAQKEQLYIRALDLRLVRHEFENQRFGGVSGGYAADRNDEVFGLEANLGFNRLLAGGTRIGTEVAAAWADVLMGNLHGGWASILTASVAQPLLRGSDPGTVLEDLTQAERDTLYQVRSFGRFRKTFVVSIIRQYYRVLQKLDVVRHAQANLDTLSWLHEWVQKRADAGRIPKLELDRISQEKLLARHIYLQAEKDYRQALDEFKISLSLPTIAEFELDTGELEALKSAEMRYPDFSETEAVDAAMHRRLDLANSADAVADAERKVLVAADSLRADANIVAAVNAISARRGNRRTLGWLREEYGLGLELNLPLDRVEEQNVYRKALITLNQREREYELATDTVALEVRRTYRDLIEAAERYKVSSEGLELAQKRFENTFLLLQYGRASSRRVLRAQQDLFEAQNAATQALVDYTIATLKFYRDTGVLRVRPDGMWEH